MICEAGTRAAVVAGWIEGKQPVSVLAGGTAAWRKAGLPLVACAPCRWTLERQVRLAAGVIVLVASLLSAIVNPRWVYLAMFVGAGLTFAGATNICGMAVVLAQMPWNRDGKPKAATVTDVECGLSFIGDEPSARMKTWISRRLPTSTRTRSTANSSAPAETARTPRMCWWRHC
jgi:hypothetical protein